MLETDLFFRLILLHTYLQSRLTKLLENYKH